MSKSRGQVKLVPFDAARYLTDDEAVAEYMTAVLETEDPDLLLLALGDVARARGMAQVAKDAGLGSRYDDAQPSIQPAAGRVQPGAGCFRRAAGSRNRLTSPSGESPDASNHTPDASNQAPDASGEPPDRETG
jgi:hypothetical protein